jgi:hypothetical protein
VRIFLKDEYVDQIDLHERVRYFARHVQIPINVAAKGKSAVISSQPMCPSVAELRKHYKELVYVPRDMGDVLENVLDADVQKYHVEIEDDGVVLGVTLLRNATLQWLPPVNLLSHHGFRVGEIHEPRGISFNLNAWCEIDFRNRTGFELTADRSRTTNRNSSMWELVTNLYGDCLIELLPRVHPDASPSEWWRYFERYFNGWVSRVPSNLEKNALAEAVVCTYKKGLGHRAEKLSDAIANSLQIILVAGPHDQLQNLDALLEDSDFVIAVDGISAIPPNWVVQLLSIRARMSC